MYVVNNWCMWKRSKMFAYVESFVHINRLHKYVTYVHLLYKISTPPKDCLEENTLGINFTDEHI